MKILPLILVLPLVTGCQVSYFLKSGYGQLQLMNSQITFEEALSSERVSAEEKKKLHLAEEAKLFAENTLHLKKSKNYSKYVPLDRSHVTYVVSAAPKWELKQHLWSYPIVGKMPYKGYFDLENAKEEQADLIRQDLDTYLRGVSAYSTLGWFNDPLLSSMLRYSDYDLVNTLIHETVHATLYIKNAADFNERLATFVGNKGAELFYLQKEGPESKTLSEVQNINHDHHLFSSFITNELADLKKWYQENTEKDESKRTERIRLVQKRFQSNVLPQMKSKSYLHFTEIELNNARLLIYKTYVSDLSDFERLYELSNKDFSVFLTKCKSLEGTDDPEAALKKLIATSSL